MKEKGATEVWAVKCVRNSIDHNKDYVGAVYRDVGLGDERGRSELCTQGKSKRREES